MANQGKNDWPQANIHASPSEPVVPMGRGAGRGSLSGILAQSQGYAPGEILRYACKKDYSIENTPENISRQGSAAKTFSHVMMNMNIQLQGYNQRTFTPEVLH